MRDFKAGRDINVEGGIVISETANHESKPLQLYTYEELLDERTHRNALLDNEIKSKNSTANFFYLIGVVSGLAISVWYFGAGKVHGAMFIIGFLGVLVPFYTGMKTSSEKTEFEQRQLNALKEIAFLLREKKAKRELFDS